MTNKLTFTDIQYQVLDFDFSQLEVGLETFESNDVLKLRLQLIEEWEISANFDFLWMFIFPDNGRVQFKI